MIHDLSHDGTSFHHVCIRKGNVGKSIEALTWILLLEYMPDCWGKVMLEGLRMRWEDLRLLGIGWAWACEGLGLGQMG